MGMLKLVGIAERGEAAGGERDRKLFRRVGKIALERRDRPDVDAHRVGGAGLVHWGAAGDGGEEDQLGFGGQFHIGRHGIARGGRTGRGGKRRGEAGESSEEKRIAHGGQASPTVTPWKAGAVSGRFVQADGPDSAAHAYHPRRGRRISWRRRGKEKNHGRTRS